MVYVKRVELSHFKSFGGTTRVPLLPGFTVVSGPNGSGKSNILDALLFCLGLSSSKGMRADRLPDLVNHKHSTQRKTNEASVTVTFDLEEFEFPAIEVDEGGNQENGDPPDGVSEERSNSHSQVEDIPEETKVADTRELIPIQHAADLQHASDRNGQEWSVTRRLRVTRNGSYSSTYYINGEVCTATELHGYLQQLRIYPEGYNVVLQGDVTGIITMKSRERREIIDELAGVAEFDRKIEKTKQTLDAVKEREDRCHIIEQELVRSRDRLADDRIKAEKYQKLKQTVQEKQQWETVLIWRSLQQRQQQLLTQIAVGEKETQLLQEQREQLTGQIEQAHQHWEDLNDKVKSLGEDEQLAVASKLATQKAQQQQLQQRQQEFDQQQAQIDATIRHTEAQITHFNQELARRSTTRQHLTTESLPAGQAELERMSTELAQQRERAAEIASASEAWVQEQTALTRKIHDLQEQLTPQRTEQAQLNERRHQLETKIAEQSQRLQATEVELDLKAAAIAQLTEQTGDSEQQIQLYAKQLAAADKERVIHQETQLRLHREQREKLRQLDKLEATKQAQQEVQGTYATQLILQSDLPGVCGLVVQLAQVESRYQLALEIAAGGRLGHVVVEDDAVAAAGIALLKQQRAGRATFLPLNKIQGIRGGAFARASDRASMRSGDGLIDLAVNLIDCDPRYRAIFDYIFGTTAVFATLEQARKNLGRQRIVTLDGDLLESSGAMTGGSRPKRSNLHFGNSAPAESEELAPLRSRLAEIERMLDRSDHLLAQSSADVKQLTQRLTEARQGHREQQLRLEQAQQESARLTTQREQLIVQLEGDRQELATVSDRLQILDNNVPLLETQLQLEQERLKVLEASQTHSEWLGIQAHIKTQEVALQEQAAKVRQLESQIQDVDSQIQRLDEKSTEARQGIESTQLQQQTVTEQQSALEEERQSIQAEITATETLLEKLSEHLVEAKQTRDRAEAQWRSLQNQHQEKTWAVEKLHTSQQERHEVLVQVRSQLAEQQTELPDPLPELPERFTAVRSGEVSEEEGVIDFAAHLEPLQKEIRSGQKRLEAMEPVNMLALEAFEQTQKRLDELTDKLTTLEGERTELLLRIENFTTLRFHAFKEAYDAVNDNFQSIFAKLSDGDGHLQLDDAEDPFNGGLNLVAHPKGKPVQRLSSMSGGEKSLTALSFIFALQRYRPSPFYAFDEVDMFLDGANVERLSKMIQQQAQQAQFIVVSLRRPMIEAAERTIGVTQARGAHTQVLGIKL